MAFPDMTDKWATAPSTPNVKPDDDARSGTTVAQGWIAQVPSYQNQNWWQNRADNALEDLRNKKVEIHDTEVTMIADTTLTVGMLVKTKGKLDELDNLGAYFVIGDGGVVDPICDPTGTDECLLLTALDGSGNQARAKRIQTFVESEVNNAISDTSITHSDGDLHQLSKSISNYVSNGSFYIDSGTGANYSLNTISTNQSPTSYRRGMHVSFTALNTNTTTTPTVDVAGLGAKNITGIDGLSIDLNTISTKGLTTLVFDSVNDRFIYSTSRNNVVNRTDISAIKSDTSLALGKVVTTEYHTNSVDGGSATYDIVSGGTGTANDALFIDMDNGLQAKLRITTGINTAQLGVVSTSAVNNSTKLQIAADLGLRVSHDITCEASGPVIMKVGSHFYGTGRMNKVGSNSYLASDSNTYDPLFVFNGSFSRAGLEGISINDNDISAGVSSADAILLDTCFLHKFEDITITNFNNAFLPAQKDFFMITFKDINIISCENAFPFDNAFFKTTLHFERCYCQNVGKAYQFQKMQYSTLSTCAADHVNDKDVTNPYDGIGRGSKSTNRGIYDFNGCTGISVNGCGTEASYGNGVIRFNASRLVVNGFKSFNIQSEYVAANPAWYLGPIGSSDEAGLGSTVTLDGIEVSDWTNGSYDINKQAFIAYNHSNGAYGAPGVRVVQASRFTQPAGLTKQVGGQGDEEDVLLTFNVPDTIESDQYIRYESKTLVAGGGGTQIVLPFLTAADQNRVGFIRLVTISNVFNTTVPRVGVADIEFNHLGAITGQALVSSSGNIASVGATGLDLEINLTNALTDIQIYVELMGAASLQDNFDYANASFV